MPKKPTYEQLENRIRELEKAKYQRVRANEDPNAFPHQNLHQIIKFLPNATYVIDHGGQVLAWNRAIENLTGIKAEFMLGKKDYEYAIPFYKKRTPDLIDLVISNDHSLEHLYTYLKRDKERYESQPKSTWIIGRIKVKNCLPRLNGYCSLTMSCPSLRWAVKF